VAQVPTAGNVAGKLSYQKTFKNLIYMMRFSDDKINLFECR
jgi:hypothetical protein